MPALLTPPTITDATRREFLAALGAAGLLTACGSDEDSSPDSGSVGGYPRTVDHELGSVELPREPERVITIGDGIEFDSLVALGRPPAATGLLFDATTFQPWVPAEGLDVVETFPGSQNFAGVDIEAVAARRPDLILGPARDRGEGGPYESLTRLAPVVATPGGEPGNPNSWRDTLDLVARCIAREERAAALATAVADQIDGFRRVATEVEAQTVTVVSNYEGQGVYVFTEATPQGDLFSRLGFTRPPNEAPQGLDGFDLSAERVGELDGDIVVLLDYDDPDLNDRLLADPLFSRTRAVTAGRVVRLPFEVGIAAFFASVLSLPWALDQTARLLRDTPR